jgi:hypothetical protein
MSKKTRATPPVEPETLVPEKLTEPVAVDVGAVVYPKLTVRMRELPVSLAALTMPSDKTVECDASLAALLIELGYADAV